MGSAAAPAGGRARVHGPPGRQRAAPFARNPPSSLRCVTRVALHPNKLSRTVAPDPALQKVAVESACRRISFQPFLLPAAHPLGQRVNDVLGLSQYTRFASGRDAVALNRSRTALSSPILLVPCAHAARPVVVVDILRPAQAGPGLFQPSHQAARSLALSTVLRAAAYRAGGVRTMLRDDFTTGARCVARGHGCDNL